MQAKYKAQAKPDIEAIKNERTGGELSMLQCFCYDHAPEITAMINMRLELATSGKSTTLEKNSSSAAEQSKAVKSRHEELQQLRDKYFNEQQPQPSKQIKEP